MKTVEELTTLSIAEAIEYANTLTIGISEDAVARYITKGRGRNNGLWYLHLDKLLCLKNDKQHRISFVWSNVVGSKVKVDDFGRTREQMLADDLAEFNSYGADLVNKINNLFPETWLFGKITIAKFLTDGKDTLSLQTVLQNNSVKYVLYPNGIPQNTTWEDVFNKLRDTVNNS